MTTVADAKVIVIVHLEITTRHMQKLEAGEHAPSLPLLVTLHKELEATWEDLFAGL